jgi:NAD(P)-dependent dehydrogenase (short-subunit alcohol dehydrogenase family)
MAERRGAWLPFCAADPPAQLTLEVPARLGALGARLVLVGRNRSKGEVALARLRARVPGVAAEMHYADLSRPDEIVRLADALLDTAARIDVLLNNAGAFFARHEITPDGLERTFALNHMGYFRLTALLRPRLITSAPARIVNIASEAHRGTRLDFGDLQCSKGYSGWMAYKRSKLANILFTRERAPRLQGTTVTANCLHPGFVATGFADNNSGLWRVIFAIAKQVSAITVQRGAETRLRARTLRHERQVFRQMSLASTRRAGSRRSMAARLWKESEKLAGFKLP